MEKFYKTDFTKIPKLGHTPRMQKLRKRFVALAIVLAFGPLTPAVAESAPLSVLIVEVQTGGAGSGTASHEFVKLHNPTPTPVTVTDWKLQYRAANKLPTDPWPANKHNNHSLPDRQCCKLRGGDRGL